MSGRDLHARLDGCGAEEGVVEGRTTQGFLPGLLKTDGIGASTDVGAQADGFVSRLAPGPDDAEQGERVGQLGGEFRLDLIDTETPLRRDTSKEPHDVGGESAQKHFRSGETRLGNVKAPAPADQRLLIAGIEANAAARFRRDPDADQRPLEGVSHAGFGTSIGKNWAAGGRDNGSMIVANN